MADRKVIPADARLAAKRAFVRTTSQAYGTALSSLVITAAVLWEALTGLEPWQMVVGVVAFVASPLVAGAGAYFSILGKGVPEEYQAEERPRGDGPTGGG